MHQPWSWQPPNEHLLVSPETFVGNFPSGSPSSYALVPEIISFSIYEMLKPGCINLVGRHQTSFTENSGLTLDLADDKTLAQYLMVLWVCSIITACLLTKLVINLSVSTL